MFNLTCRMEMLDCSLDWSGCSSDLLVNKMVKWDCSLDSLGSRRGLLASTGDSSGCSSGWLVSRMERWGNNWGLMESSSGLLGCISESWVNRMDSVVKLRHQGSWESTAEN